MGDKGVLGLSDKQISIRLSTDTLDRADELVKVLNEVPLYKPFKITRADIIRIALSEGMETLEKRYEKKQ